MKTFCGFRIQIFWAWYNCWIGFYWDRESQHLYVCPIPMVVIEICKLPPLTWEDSTTGVATELDYLKCPECGGPTEWDRCLPPNPYWCDKCTEGMFLQEGK